MSFAPTVPNQHHRAGDLVDPLWGLLDMTPEGRGDVFSEGELRLSTGKVVGNLIVALMGPALQPA